MKDFRESFRRIKKEIRGTQKQSNKHNVKIIQKKNLKTVGKNKII